MSDFSPMDVSTPASASRSLLIQKLMAQAHSARPNDPIYAPSTFPIFPNGVSSPMIPHAEATLPTDVLSKLPGSVLLAHGISPVSISTGVL